MQVDPCPVVPDEEMLVADLVARGRLAPEGLARARAAAARGSEPLHAVLVRLGLVPDRDMAEALGATLGLALATSADYPSAPPEGLRLGVRFLRQNAVLPLQADATRLLLAMADPFDGFARRAVEIATGLTVEPRVAVLAELEAALARLDAEPETAAAPAAQDLEDDVARLRDLASEAPVIRMANALVDRAAASGASDIHIAPLAGRLSIRLRIDGVLRESEAPGRGLHAALLSRLKLMAGLDIAERRLPQDGRIRVVHAGRELDLRVATVPGLHGESMVIRLLNREAVPLDLEALGLSPVPLAAFRRLLAQPNGIVLVTGPTGSGKTTTLYAALTLLNRPGAKLMSVEDPVEYLLDGVVQVQVQPAIGLDFARVLRAILRHDPDIVLLGEIRDRETAEIAMQAALTGHLVLSTLHTNGAAATVGRLLDMGVADHLIAATLRGVLAQRLVRRLCTDCRAPAAGWREGFAAVGCPACNGSGYRGRVAVTEVLPMSDALRRLVVRRADAGAIAEAAAGAGMQTLHADGMAKVALGLTTPEEVWSVTRDE